MLLALCDRLALTSLRCISVSSGFVQARCLNNLAKRPSLASMCRYSDGVTSTSGRRRNVQRFLIAMSQEEKERKLKEIEKMRTEAIPTGLFAKCKYYFKRYWYIAIPVHTLCCTIWFIALYVAVKSGVDILALLKSLHMPESLVQKVQNTPESAGVFVVALLLYKIAVPLRYATSLAGIQLTFWALRRMGKLKTAREVGYGVRTRYDSAIIRLNERRNRSAMISPNNTANVTPTSTLLRILSRREKRQQQQQAPASASQAQQHRSGSAEKPPTSSSKPHE